MMQKTKKIAQIWKDIQSKGYAGSEYQTVGWVVGSAIRPLIFFLTYVFFLVKTAQKWPESLYIATPEVSNTFWTPKQVKR